MKKRVTFAVFVCFLLLTAPAFSNTITNVSAPPSPNAFEFSELVYVDFDFEVDVDSHIFVRPMYNGALTSYYMAHGSYGYDAGSSGSDTGWFTIWDGGQGPTYVDQIRVWITSADLSDTLFEHFESVDYVFGGPNPNAPVPEPTTMLLLSTGLVGLAGFRKKLKK